MNHNQIKRKSHIININSIIFSSLLLSAQVAYLQVNNQTSGYTAWGDPDIQGVYRFQSDTPLERDPSLGNREYYTPEELAERGVATVAGAATETERDRLLARTSLIIDPPNGRLPPLTDHGQSILDQYLAERAPIQYGPVVAWEIPDIRALEDLIPYNRCIARPMPRMWQSYNNGTWILQTPDHVVIFYETMHDTRIIPLDGRPELDEDVRFWNGDSRGYWDNDTLVVVTKNFGKQWMDGGFSGPPIQFPMDNMTITEKFRRIDDNTLDYEFTVEDSTIWTQPWTYSVPWRSDNPMYQSPKDLYEYACHEGNYRTMENTLGR